MTKIIIISDTHLSNKEEYSWFKQRDADNLARFLVRTANDRQVNELVLLGDIFDLWLYPLSVTPWNVQQIVAQWGDVINALRECVEKLQHVYYINGNHDMTVQESELLAAISPNIKWSTHERYNTRRPNLLHVEHGNDADLFNAPPPYPSGYLITRIAAAAAHFTSFFDIGRQIRSASDRQRTESNRFMDAMATRGAGTLPQAAIDLESEKLRMIDALIEQAANDSSVNINELVSMPDGQRMSIDALKKQFSMQLMNTTDLHRSASEYKATRYRNADNFRAVAAAGPHRDISDVLDSALAVTNLDWHAKNVLQETSAHVVVMGHTHEAKWRELLPGRWYANSGCWCERDAGNPPTYVTVFPGDQPAVEVLQYGGEHPDKLIQRVSLNQ